MEFREPAVVASGVDALVLSGAVEELPRTLVLDLEHARERARRDEAPTPFVLGGLPVAMNPGPYGRYRFSVEHENARFGLTQSPNLPAIRVQFRARFIHAVGTELALIWLATVIGSTGLEPVWSVSRIDLFADIQGWPLTAEDRRAFVARADKRRTYENGDDLTGLQWGVGGAVLARIYDKSRETEDKGSDWWPDVWSRSAAYVPGLQVERVEYQVTRDFLRQRNLDDPEAVLNLRRSIWKYLTRDWLSLRVTSPDSNRSRWPVANVWEVVQAADLNGAAIGEDLVRAAERVGDARRLIPALVGYAASLTASQGGETTEDVLETLRWACGMYELRKGVSIEDLVAAKKLKRGEA
jgi:hypothetical protein